LSTSSSARHHGLLARAAAFIRSRARSSQSPARSGAPSPADEALRKLWWLTDVPTFINEALVDRLYSAIIRPEYVLLQRSETTEQTRSLTSSSEAEAGGELSLPTFWKLGAKGKVGAEVGEGSSRGTQVTKQFVQSVERRLQDIISHYGVNHPDRLLFEQAGQSGLVNLSGEGRDWDEAVALLDIPGPRPLLFIELDRSVPILPMAGGTQAGRTVLLSLKMIAEMEKRGGSIPDFPRDDDKNAQKKKTAHWDALLRHYDNREARRIVADSFGDDHRLEWIDFRIKVGTRRRPVHVHFVAEGKYHAGEFAYNLVRRGFKEGLRLVGQLKRGCDISIISVYER